MYPVNLVRIYVMCQNMPEFPGLLSARTGITIGTICHFTLHMQIFVKDPNGKTITLDVEPTETVADLRRKVGDRFPGIASTTLLVAGKVLRDEIPISEYSIQNGTTVNSAVPLQGGY